MPAGATAIETATTLADPIGPERSYRLSVDQYLRMGELGILDPRDRVVLLEGRLVTKMTKHPPHILAAKKAFDRLRGLAPAGWHVAKEDPIVAAASVPEPDLLILRGAPDDYRGRLPGPGDVALVVEVADSSLRLDQTVTLAIYAEGAIPAYGIINIPDRRLEVYTDPTGPAPAPSYRQRRDFGPGDEVPLVIEGREVGRIAARDLLP